MRVEDDRRKDDERRTRSGMERSVMPERRKAEPQASTGPTDTAEVLKFHRESSRFRADAGFHIGRHKAVSVAAA